MEVSSGNLKSATLGLLVAAIVTACIAIIPLAARLGLLILETAPNPRHPPSDLLGEAIGWAIVGAGAGLISTVIGEALTSFEERGFFIYHRGLIIGTAVGIIIGTFLGMNFAVLQMDSVDGQAITSTTLGIMAGATVASLAAVAGAVLGVVGKRVLVALVP
jgi:hypothetical protein